jgi:hypothetical protein
MRLIITFLDSLEYDKIDALNAVLGLPHEYLGVICARINKLLKSRGKESGGNRQYFCPGCRQVALKLVKENKFACISCGTFFELFPEKKEKYIKDTGVLGFEVDGKTLSEEEMYERNLAEVGIAGKN